METWLVYAIASIFLGGMYSFFVKVAAERKYNSSLITAYSYFVGSVCALVYFLYKGETVINIQYVFIFAFINVLFYFFSILSRMESMKNIDSVIYFPLYKTFSPIFITLSSLFFFGENLVLKEYLGIALGICVPLLLITSHENKRQKNLKLGVIFVVIASVFVMISNSAGKEARIMDLDISFFILVAMFIGLIISLISYRFFHKNDSKKHNKKGIVKLGLIMGLFHFLTFVAFQTALEGNLAIVFTINSFSILIPIILSIIIYKDHFNAKKGFVILLSIISVILFI